MEFSFSKLIETAKTALADPIGKLENMVEQRLPQAKTLIDQAQNGQLGDLQNELLNDLKTGNLAAAGQAVLTKFNAFQAQNEPKAAQTETETEAETDDEDDARLPLSKPQAA